MSRHFENFVLICFHSSCIDAFGAIIHRERHKKVRKKENNFSKNFQNFAILAFSNHAHRKAQGDIFSNHAHRKAQGDIFSKILSRRSPWCTNSKTIDTLLFCFIYIFIYKFGFLFAGRGSCFGSPFTCNQCVHKYICYNATLEWPRYTRTLYYGRLASLFMTTVFVIV